MNKKFRKITAVIAAVLMLVMMFAEVPAAYAVGEAAGTPAPEGEMVIQEDSGKGLQSVDEAEEVLEEKSSNEQKEQNDQKEDQESKDEEEKADYAAVDAAIASVPEDLSIYTDESVAALNQALDAVVRDKPASEQAEVDAMAQAITDAINGLVPKDPSQPVIKGNPALIEGTYFYVRMYSNLLNDYSKEWYQNYEGNTKVRLDARFYIGKESTDSETGVTTIGEGSSRGESKYKALVKKGWKFVFAIKSTNGTTDQSDDTYVKDNLTFDQIGQKGKNKGYKLKVKNDTAYYLEVRATDPADPENVLTAKSLPRTVKYTFLKKPTDVKVKRVEDDNAAVLTWDEADDAVCYAIYMSTNGKCPKKPIAHTKQDSGETTYTKKYLEGPKTYTFFVKAMYRNETGGASGKMWTVSKASSGAKLKIKERLLGTGIRCIKWTAKIKYTATLYSNQGCTSSKGTIPKGTRVYCTGKYPKKIPRGGHPTKYQVEYTKKGKTLKGWVRRGPITGVTAEVAYKHGKAYDYSKATKEYYVNKKGFSSSTKYLIWMSSYTQRVNIYKGSKGKWELIKTARCTSGRFDQWTALGYGYKVHRHQMTRYRNFLNSTAQYYYKYLSYFSKGNSFHTYCWRVGSNKTVNHVKGNLQPGTMGCIRMYVPDATWIYKNIPLGTRVITH